MSEKRVTLTESIFWTKRIGLVVVAILGIFLFFKFILLLINGPTSTHSEYLIATNSCPTDIPPLKMTSLPLAENIDPEIILETPTGQLPDLPKVVNVYEFAHPGQSLNALEEANVLAEALGFPRNTQRKITDTDYRWTDIAGRRQLDLNLDNMNFYISTNFEQPLPQPEGAPIEIPTEEEAKQIAYNWLLELGLGTKDLSVEDTKVYFLKIVGDTPRLISSRQNADLVRVDFFRETDLIYIDDALNEAPNLGSEISNKLIQDRGTDPTTGTTIDILHYPTSITTNNPDKANISLTLNGKSLETNSGNTNLWGMEYFNWKISPLPCGTYEVIEPSEAFEEVKLGNSYLTKLQKQFGGDPFEKYEPQVVKRIVILDVELVYVDTRAKQTYLQPIYMLSGEAILGDNTKADIVFYVPAIRDPKKAEEVQTIKDSETNQEVGN